MGLLSCCMGLLLGAVATHAVQQPIHGEALLCFTVTMRKFLLQCSALCHAKCRDGLPRSLSGVKARQTMVRGASVQVCESAVSASPGRACQ